MIIQDVIFTAGNVAFDVSLIPSIIGPHKPSMWTGIMTALILVIFTLTFQSLDLYFSAAASLTGAVGWSILAYQAWEVHAELENND